MKFTVLLMLVLLSGCDFIAPDTSKAITEKQQYEELQKQNTILIDIANSLEVIAKYCKEKNDE